MFRNSEEGLGVYRVALGKYARKVARFHNKHGKESPWLVLSHADYLTFVRKDAELTGMAKVLGLTKKENRVLHREFGLL